jgi:hypothetical protein
MTDNLLDGNDSPALDPEKDYYTDLVGDGKKFKDNKALAYSKMHADLTIQMKDRMLDEMRADLQAAKAEAASRARVEELVDKLSNPGTKQPAVTGDQTKPEITLTEIETLFSKKFQEAEIQKKQQENLDMVKAELAKRFGNNLEHHLKEVGLDGESAAQMAKVNPQLVLRALGVDKPTQNAFQAPPRNTSVNSSSSNTPRRTWAYYQEIFKANPTLKYDPKTNTQMQKDYAALGQAFEDGDFNRFG